MSHTIIKNIEMEKLKIKLHHLNQEKHISQVLETLGKRCNNIERSAVITTYNKSRESTSHTFMGEDVGENLSYEQISDIQNCRLHVAADDYKEATKYYHTLKNNEGSTRNADACLYFIRKQIESAKRKKEKLGN